MCFYNGEKDIKTQIKDLDKKQLMKSQYTLMTL